MTALDTSPPISLKARYKHVLDRVAAAAKRYGRSPDSVVVVAVTKYAGIDQVRELAALGHKDFGENHIQSLMQRAAMMEEFAARRRVLPGTAKGSETKETPMRWHMVGHLQRNKVKKAVELCRLVHSVDSLRVAEELQIAANKLDKTVDVLIQVNTSGEGTKSGCAPAAAGHLIDTIETMINVRVRGLMTMAPHTENPADSRETFLRCRELYEDLRRVGTGGEVFNLLSMGMSHDFEVAIGEGANVVRIGTAIFGPPTAQTGDGGADSADEEED